ncbi:MAG TPA: AAA family ATPase, partial [Gallionella sp.]|nr:AAA family ATPase [Gallionella sp.]
NHFGLNEAPFRITPATTFFFSGANRGEILDALIYSLSEVEGIIKVSGEVGSGKTMLCRMLLERLPEHIETIYLANPSLSREEMLYAIADGLGLNVNGERVGVIMHGIQDKLEEKAREGRRVVVLVDEAHAMPPETLEELRLLYNLQVGDFKLLQIILFGQPELNTKLEQPNMRQLKDRIVHHFNMQPISRNTLESYLMFRMRAAGFHGPNIFSPEALKLIARASDGLMRRVNILADKSLLSAFVEDTHGIEARHVQAAMRDSELQTSRKLADKKLLAGGAVTAMLLTGLAVWQFLGGSGTSSEKPLQPPSAEPMIAASADNTRTEKTAATAQPIAASPALRAPQAELPHTTARGSLFDQRLAAGKQLTEQKNIVASIQLFYNEGVQPSRLEGFLKRADSLGRLPSIYLLPARTGQKDGIRVLYGAYPSVEAARSAIKDLPARYQESFATSIYLF